MNNNNFPLKGGINKIIFSETFIPENKIEDETYLNSIPHRIIEKKQSAMESKAIQVNQGITTSISNKKGEITGLATNKNEYISPFREVISTQEGIIYAIKWKENNIHFKDFEYFYPRFTWIFLGNDKLLLKGKVSFKQQIIIPDDEKENIFLAISAEIWIEGKI